VLNIQPHDEFHDLLPGTAIVSQAWEVWKSRGPGVQMQLSAISAVGTAVTRRPRHRPGRAVFPHPVPRLYSLPRRRLLAACLLLPAVRFACGLRPDSVRRKFPLQAAYFRQVLPHVTGFPRLRVLCLIRLPNGMWQSSSAYLACSSMQPLRFQPNPVSGFPLPCLKSCIPYACTSLQQEPMGPPGFSDASLPACHGLRTPADLHILAKADASCWLRAR